MDHACAKVSIQVANKKLLWMPVYYKLYDYVTTVMHFELVQSIWQKVLLLKGKTGNSKQSVIKKCLIKT